MSEKPNILLILTDDQRFDTLAAMGNPEIHTPHLDEVIGEGSAFENAYIMGGSSGAVCMPSRAMLHTGRTLYHIEQQGQAIPADHVLLGEHFRANGYETFGVGKWHNGPDAYARSFSAGAEVMFGGMSDHWNVPVCDFNPEGTYPEPTSLRIRWGDMLGQHAHPFHRFATGKHSTDLFTDSTIDFLRRQDGSRPFLAYVAYMAPHDPREMPAEFLNLYDPDALTLPGNIMPMHPFDHGALHHRDEHLAGFPRTEAEVRKHLAEYYAMISHLDARIGDLVTTLKETGQWDNTVLVLAGDNGLAVGQHGLMGKQSLYEHSIHVPLLLAGPGVPAGRRVTEPCYLLDIFPTLCDLTGLDTPETVEGQSLTPLLGDRPEPLRDAMLFAFTRFHRGVREGDMKLIEYVVEGRRHTHLFDLSVDPHETANLAGRPEQAETLSRLRRLLVRWRDELDDHQPGQGQDFWAGCEL